jgi:hypothetical protein
MRSRPHHLMNGSNNVCGCFADSPKPTANECPLQDALDGSLGRFLQRQAISFLALSENISASSDVGSELF